MDKVSDLIQQLRTASATLQTQTETTFEALSECASSAAALVTLETSIRSQIEPLETRRAAIQAHVTQLQESLASLKEEHEESERGHRQRLADMELAIRKAEDRMQELRRVMNGVTELVN